MPSAPDWLTEGYGHVWLPYTQMASVPPPLPVAATRGTRIVLADGRELIDGIASWWTACHGYNHPHIRAAVTEQLERMPHVMFGGLANEPALRLARRLAGMLPDPLNRVFFSESGSVAVEIALKMALQYWLNQGVRGRHRFVSFQGAYHGDTFAAMSVCDPEEGMHSLFAGALPEQHVVPLPEDEAGIAAFDTYLSRNGEDAAAVIVEPLVQGAGGMRFHAPEVLRTLRAACDKHGLLLIADEIMTGFGRTGTMFACEQAGVVPDIVTLSKALTGGTMALAATVASERVFEAFLSDDFDAALMHGPTFMANPFGLRRRQCLPRFVRERAPPRPGARHREPSHRRPGARAGAAGGCRCPGARRDRRHPARRHEPHRLAKGAVRGGRRLGPTLRRHRLRHAGVHHRRGRPRPAHGRADRRGDGVVKGALGPRTMVRCTGCGACINVAP